MPVREDDYLDGMELEPTDSGVPGIDITSQQLKAIRLLVNGGMKYSEICRQVGITRSLFKKWLSEPRFKRALVRYKERMDDVDAGYRRKQMQQVLPSFYDELHERTVNGSLRRLKVTTLIDSISKLTHEIRTEEDRSADVSDTPGKGEFEEIMLRFRRRKKAGDDIIDITPEKGME